MPEIGKWNGMHQLSENYYSTSPFAYVANNPISSFDVDGRFFNDDGTIDKSGIASGFIRPERAYRWSQELGQRPGEGGGMTIGNMMTGLGFEESGDMDYAIAAIGALGLRQQLIDAGWDNPENISAKFNDWYKLVSSKEIPALNNLYIMTKARFEENPNQNSPGVTSGNLISINMSENKNLLYYAFTIGHEMYGHAFANLFFKDKFSEVTRISVDSPRTFKFFQEVMGVSWEMGMGETRYGKTSALDATAFYYGGIGHGEGIIDKVRDNYTRLRYEWNLIYNIQKIKNNIK